MICQNHALTLVLQERLVTQYPLRIHSVCMYKSKRDTCKVQCNRKAEKVHPCKPSHAVNAILKEECGYRNNAP